MITVTLLCGRVLSGRALWRLLSTANFRETLQKELAREIQAKAESENAQMQDVTHEASKDNVCINGVQKGCIVNAEAQKSPLFWRFSGGFDFLRCAYSLGIPVQNLQISTNHRYLHIPLLSHLKPQEWALPLLNHYFSLLGFGNDSCFLS